VLSAPEAPAAPVVAPADHAAPPAQKQDAVREAVAALLREGQRPAPEEVRLAASPHEPRRVSPNVATAYAALATGDLDTARKGYGAALAADATNLDALLGVATVEARAGNRMLAASYYRRALEVDPRDATARAGLAALAATEQPEGLETQLRSDLSLAPASPALHFALGNYLASQNRWNEAQVEFFEAYRLDPSDPDLAYNLAVSLDHLKQGSLAAEYYDRALKGARASGAQFDAAQAARRLAQLRG
jgi:Tfp pilus assembly protein PilF